MKAICYKCKKEFEIEEDLQLCPYCDGTGNDVLMADCIWCHGTGCIDVNEDNGLPICDDCLMEETALEEEYLEEYE